MGVSDFVETKPSFKMQTLIQVLWTSSILEDSDFWNTLYLFKRTIYKI